MSQKPSIIWFRDDLRIEDNPALYAARERGGPVIGLYILDEAPPRPPGGAARWWLHHSLKSLGGALQAAGTRLILRRGDPADVIPEIVDRAGATSIFWNRRYAKGQIENERELERRLNGQDVALETFNGALLREPWEVKSGSGGPYRVFTPFWRTLKKIGPARNAALPRLRKIEGPSQYPKSDRLEDWGLLPTTPDWAREFSTIWTPGESGARHRLNSFLKNGIGCYKDNRDVPGCECVSRLSPHLSFGEISPLQVWHATHKWSQSRKAAKESVEKFLSEIAWREFSYHLLYYNSDLPEKPLRAEFEKYPWRDDEPSLRAWRKGETGYPIVDAGMRQLWRTGWMHNRVRMIVASFLVKDLLIKWQAGEAWFWDTLVDADLASNSANWQWVAGCGADAAPYFRIFNPVAQGEKFDPDGAYIRAFVPELAKMPAKFIHAPWKAPQEILTMAGVTLGKSYKNPIVDHDQARMRALMGYDIIRKS